MRLPKLRFRGWRYRARVHRLGAAGKRWYWRPVRVVGRFPEGIVYRFWWGAWLAVVMADRVEAAAENDRRARRAIGMLRDEIGHHVFDGKAGPTGPG